MRIEVSIEEWCRGGGGGEKKVTKFSFSVAKPSNRRPPLPPKVKEKEAVVVEYVTSVDAEAGIVVANPRAGSGARAVPKQENSWRPEKRMKNIMMESDATKSTDETFIVEETIGAGPKPNVQYGLTVIERVENWDGVEASAPVRRVSLKEIEDQKLKEDLANLPEEATLDQYEELPVEEFGEALLRGMGWEKGKPIGRNSKTIVTVPELVRRPGTLGLGAVPVPPKATEKKYIKPGETREKGRAEYVKAKGSGDMRREENVRSEEPRERRREEKSRKNGSDEYGKSRDSRETRRDRDPREKTRDEYSKSKDSWDHRREEEPREHGSEEYRKSRDSRSHRRDDHSDSSDFGERKREEHTESRGSRDKRREEYSKRSEPRESRRDHKGSDRRSR